MSEKFVPFIDKNLLMTLGSKPSCSKNEMACGCASVDACKACVCKVHVEIVAITSHYSKIINFSRDFCETSDLRSTLIFH